MPTGELAEVLTNLIKILESLPPMVQDLEKSGRLAHSIESSLINLGDAVRDFTEKVVHNAVQDGDGA